MVQIISKKTILPENIEKYLEIAKELIEKSQAEQGCIEYTFKKQHGVENVYAYSEKWETYHIATEVHPKTEHFARLVPILNALTTGENELILLEDI